MGWPSETAPPLTLILSMSSSIIYNPTRRDEVSLCCAIQITALPSLPHPDHGVGKDNAGKRLVDLPEGNVVLAHAGILEGARHGHGGRGGKVDGVLAPIAKALRASAGETKQP